MHILSLSFTVLSIFSSNFVHSQQFILSGNEDQNVLIATASHDAVKLSYGHHQLDEINPQEETANLVFTTIASLMQQWPNTRFRNGHTVAKGVIPVGTVLYHGRLDKDVPEIPEWLATNPEHSYIVCAPPECWMLSFMVEQELNVIYFDGSSAANSIYGHQDTQDLLIWGEVRPDKIWAEWERMVELCKWVEQRGLDAIIRMEPGFEIMLCDFKKKLKLISSVHIMTRGPGAPSNDSQDLSDIDLLQFRQSLRQSHPNIQMHEGASSSSQDFSGPVSTTKDPWPPTRTPGPQPLPPGWSGPLRDGHSVQLEAMQAALWNSLYPGESRVKIDYSRLISFYDPSYTSLVDARRSLALEGKGRNYHRMSNISRMDYKRAIRDLDEDLSRNEPQASGIDWSTLTRTVIDRYADRLRLLYLTLNQTQSTDLQHLNATTIAIATRHQVMIMLMPYLVYGAVPSPSTSGISSSQDSRNTSWVNPIKHHCSTTLTASITMESLTRSERMIKSATEGVLNRICFTLTDIWADALSVANPTVTVPEASILVKSWKDQVQSLMKWLDWPVWDTCRPACPEQMFCYIPTWPWGIPWEQQSPDLDMTPRCVQRFNGEL